MFVRIGILLKSPKIVKFEFQFHLKHYNSIFTIQSQFTELNILPVDGLNGTSSSWGDYDNDGFLDLLVTGMDNQPASISKVLRNNGSGGFVEQSAIQITGVVWGSVEWGDYNRDGYLDILLSGLMSGTIPVTKVYKNNRMGGFIELSSLQIPGVQSGSVSWGDSDNDGDLDILMTGWGVNSSLAGIYTNNGDDTFTLLSSVNLLGVSRGSVAWNDFNNDGYLDFVISGYEMTKLYKNSGNKTFSEINTNFVGVGNGCTVDWQDFNNDGWSDLLVTGLIFGTGPTSKLYKNNKNETFTELSEFGVINLQGSSVAWGDYNNDGKSDIAVAGYNAGQHSKVYENISNEVDSFLLSVDFYGIQDGSVEWADYDNDKDLDLLISGGGMTKIFRNNNDKQNQRPEAPSSLSAIQVENEIILNWERGTDIETPQAGLNYNVWIGTGINNANIVVPMANISTGLLKVVRNGNSQSNSYKIKDILPGKYYWSVQSIDGAYSGSQFANIDSFQVIEKPMVTMLELPENNSKGLLPPIVLVWKKTPRAERYILQVSQSSQFNSFVVNDSVMTDTSKILSTLSNFTQYYWRVKAANIGGQSDWSEVWNFKTLGNPYASTLIQPANNSVNHPLNNVVFKWIKARERIETIQKYQYQLSTDSLFANVVVSDTTLTDTTKSVSGLSYLTKYYWRVRASNQTGWGDWSEVWRFTTIIEKPANFTLAAPANNAKGLLNPVTVSWNNSARAERYILQVATDSLFTSFVVNDSAQTDLTEVLPTLNNYTQFYWRVKAVNTGGQSEWTPVWNFKTLGNPYASVLYTPANNSVNQPVAGLTFNWSKAKERIETIQKYQLQISTDSLFTTFVLNDSTLTDTTKVMNGLGYLTRYHWRARAQNQTGWGDWSDRWATTTIIEKPAIISLASPANNTTQLLQPVTLKWFKPLRADIYRLEVSETSNFASLVFVDSTLTDTVKVLPQLEAPKTYYWRVRSSNIGGVSDYSSVWNFRTLGKPLSVTLASPANNSTLLPVTGVKLSWFKAGEQTMSPAGGGNSRNFRNDDETTSSQLSSPSKETGLLSDGRISGGQGIEGGVSILGYWLQMTTDTSGAIYTISDSTLTDTFKVLPALNYLSSYFWRVKALNENGWGAFSGWYRFTTIIERPSQPLLASPANNTLGLVQPVTLKWHSAHRAEKYALEVSTTANFSAVVHKDTSLTDTSKLLPVLGVYTQHYWRVTAKNAGGTSDTSAIFSFKTLGTPAGVSLVTPAQNAQNIQAANVLFNWTKAYDRIETILGYRFELKTDTSQPGYIVLDSLLTDTTKTVSQLLNSTSYYWRVGAKNEAGWGEPTAWNKFTTIVAAPAQVMLQQPANNALSVAVRPQFKWSRVTGSERYLIEVSENQGFTSVVLRDSLVTDTVKIFTDSLLFNKKYYWRVKASNIGGQGSYSAVWSFTTLKRSIAAPANLTAVASEVKKVTLNWTDKSDNESGFIIFRKQGDSVSTNTLTAIDTSSANSVQYMDTTVVTDPLLFSYRIIAYNPDTISAPSNYAVVLTLTDVTDRTNGTLPDEYSIQQNYPNPFNPSTTIRYGLPYDSDVRLEIYDISGQKLQTLVSETQSAGYYEAVFDISGMSSGTYLYILTATRLDGDGEFHQVKKMILLK